MPPLLNPLTWNADAASRSDEIDWLWPGFLARGNLTLLTGGWKAGKTTLLSFFLDRRRGPMEDPGGTEGEVCLVPRVLLNRSVLPGATVVVSEEDLTLWRRRQRRLDFGPRVGFWCRPFAGRPTPEAWHALLDQLLDLRDARGIDLVVIDPLAMFLPGSENHPASLLGPLADLQRLTRAGLAVLLLHHPAKGEPRLGQAARGSGALSACADILLELRVPRGGPTTRRRLFGFSRFEETPHRLTVELDPTGTDYAVLADSGDDEMFVLALRFIRAILRQAEAPQTRQQILAAWPAAIPAPQPVTLWRWLARAVSLKALERTGAGTRTEAYRYGLASVEP